MNNGNLKMKWLIGILIPIVIGLIVVLYGSTLAAQLERDINQTQQTNRLVEVIDNVSTKLNAIDGRLNRIEGRLGLDIKLQKVVE